MREIQIPLTDTPQDLTPAQIAYLLGQKTLIEKWLKGVQEYARIKMDAKPGSVPGWGFGPPSRTREWVSEDAAAKAIASLGVNDVYTRKIKSVAELEKETSADKVAALEKADGWAWQRGKPSLVRVLVAPVDETAEQIDVPGW
jgi:hypothetical protein